MSNDVSRQVRDFICRVADPGTQWRWEWPYDSEDARSNLVVAFIDIRSTKLDDTIMIDFWYMSANYQDHRPPGVALGEAVPFQVFYDAIAAGRLKKVTASYIRMPADDDYETVRNALVGLMNHHRYDATIQKVVDACGERFSIEMAFQALCAMHTLRIVGWADTKPTANTVITILRPAILRDPNHRR